MILGALDRASDRPPFRQIADDLRSAIERGELQPGDRLPSEAKLMKHYDVARMTARQAVQELRGEGRVVAEQGRGVFVRQAPPVRRLASERFARRHRKAGLAAFSAEAEKSGFVPRVDQIEVTRQVPPPAVRERLHLGEGDETVVRSRRYLADGRPIETAISYVPVDLAEGTRIAEPDTGPGGIYARLEEAGHELARFTEEVSARMPTAEERRRLDLSPGTPVIVLSASGDPDPRRSSAPHTKGSRAWAQPVQLQAVGVNAGQRPPPQHPCEGATTANRRRRRTSSRWRIIRGWWRCGCCATPCHRIRGTTRAPGRPGSTCCLTSWPPPSAIAGTTSVAWLLDRAATYRLHERALGMRHRLLGPDHPHTLESANNLAGDLRESGSMSGPASWMRTPSPAGGGCSVRTTRHPHRG